MESRKGGRGRTAVPAGRGPAGARGLKFSEALPERLATATLAARMADLHYALLVLGERARFTTVDAFQADDWPGPASE